MAGQAKVSKRLEAWVDSDTRFQALKDVQGERIRPEKVGPGLLQARAQDARERPYDVTVRLSGTNFSYDCDCATARSGRICKHIFGTVLLAESMGVEGFRRRVIYQRSGATADVGSTKSAATPQVAEAASDAEEELASSGPATLGTVRDETSQVAYFEVHGLESDGAPLKVSLAQCWKRRDETVFSRAPGWRGVQDKDIPEALTQVLDRLTDYPVEPEQEDDDVWWSGARLDALRNGTAACFEPEEEAPVLSLIARTECAARVHPAPADPLQWTGTHWQVLLRPTPADPDDPEGDWRIEAYFQEGEREIPVHAFDAVSRGGVVRHGNELGWLRSEDLVGFVSTIRRVGELRIPADKLDDFLVRMWELPVAPVLDLPPDRVPTRRQMAPRGQLVLRSFGRERFRGTLRFLYGSQQVDGDDCRSRVLDPERWESIERSPKDEEALREELSELLRRRVGVDLEEDFSHDRLAEVMVAMEEAGFEVWTEEQRLRSLRPARIQVSSGIDWFDVEGSHDFGDGVSLSLPRLLQAIGGGGDAAGALEGTVTLDDGSLGLVPSSWLQRAARIMELGETEGDAIRFRRNQAVWVDQLLESADLDPGVVSARSDEAFQRVQTSLHEGVKAEAAEPDEQFRGELRPYQQEGLGWLRFLAEIGFGGILADDMGLGKTVQVLAHLQRRRSRSQDSSQETIAPSLVVAPRSVVHQWKSEAAGFTPEITVHAHLGPQRTHLADELRKFHLVVTSYGILRRDVELLGEIDWDLVVLDEAQAVKNSTTVTARAARQLRAEQRLVVTGTPVENHLGELANHLDFLNPGLFGPTSALREKFCRQLDEDGAKVVATALQPLLLRRTKQQVAADLPERIEQDLICEMTGEQQRLYDELRTHFAQNLIPTARQNGLPSMKIKVLEALLRLRQAACHPGLVDPLYTAVASAKFEVMLPRLEELIDEGAKALVFSQFTSHLGLLKPELDRRGIRYEYLDGSTRDRPERIQRFQEDPEVSLFLISLKAGGVGLNLTAAQYVFLMDPWWNPAVEAQAIDRAHRHGQVNQVVAYRLLTRNTVEEKIRELQQKKQALAASILGEDSSILRELSPDDLEVLLG